MDAVAVAAVDGGDVGEQAVATAGRCDDGRGHTVRIYQRRL